MKRWLAALFACLFLSPLAARAGEQKLIALTFDDGPRPYVLLGRPGEHGLLDLLDRQQVKATFFVMGWRLTPGTHGDRHEPQTEVTCLEAAREVVRRGHEIENHSYSHVQFRLFEKQHGEGSAVADVDRAAALIKSLTGRAPQFVRPPDWITWSTLDQQLEARGYRVMSIGDENPPALRDINSADYLCAGEHPADCPKPSLNDFVRRQIEQRERHGVTTHILVFHELSSTVTALETLIPELKARGYRFVRLDEYMKLAGATTPRRAARPKKKGMVIPSADAGARNLLFAGVR